MLSVAFRLVASVAVLSISPLAVLCSAAQAPPVNYNDNPHRLPDPVHTAELGHRPANREYYRNGTELVPVYPGYGTHYTFIYVGTPPQRQSVIIDTGELRLFLIY
jgi:hypothetical protein